MDIKELADLIESKLDKSISIEEIEKQLGKKGCKAEEFDKALLELASRFEARLSYKP